ncbi:hypothetical protein [Thiofilum flexile]|uniref:hypothetical protein n=1 Tax=Thiofilum flexile TaxID=125627 RepID=UPI0003750B05|nr:hypothetical protein [Thiofilum flexile]
MTHNVIIRSISVLLFGCVMWHTAQAIDAGAEKIDLKRGPSGAALTKGDVVMEIKRQNLGRILSISKDKKGGEDCHVVKLLTPISEFKTIHVTCQF